MPDMPAEFAGRRGPLGVAALGVAALGVAALGVAALGVAALGVAALGVAELGVAEGQLAAPLSAALAPLVSLTPRRRERQQSALQCW
jgi:hypothetical protein